MLRALEINSKESRVALIIQVSDLRNKIFRSFTVGALFWFGKFYILFCLHQNFDVSKQKLILLLIHNLTFFGVKYTN